MRIVSIPEIEDAISNPEKYAVVASVPSYLPIEWDEDHSNYVIGVVLPEMKLAVKIRRIAIEAYLAGMEKESDGSSVVPDEWNWKDIWGVMHDYIFRLHRENRADAYGNKWSLAEANAVYRDGWIASGRKVRGWAWWVGLTVGSWFVWYFR